MSLFVCCSMDLHIKYIRMVDQGHNFFFRSLKNHFVRKKIQLNFRKLSIRCNNDTICDGKHPILTKIHSIAEHYKAVFECPSKSMSLKQAIWLGIVYRSLMELNQNILCVGHCFSSIGTTPQVIQDTADWPHPEVYYQIQSCGWLRW